MKESYRSRFEIPLLPDGTESIYLAGNSLGLLPKRARELIEVELDSWRSLGVGGYFGGANPWVRYRERLVPLLTPILGAEEDEIAVMNGLTTNLHLLLVSFYRPTPERFRILTAHRPFPSDRFALESQLRLHGFDPLEGLVIVEPRTGESTIRTEDLLGAIDEHAPGLALVMVDAVNYVTGEYLDLEAIARRSRERSIPVGFDLAHAAGNVPLRLHDWEPDFAVWCSYKYLNGGPGAPGGAFVHRKHLGRTDLPRLHGWWGNDHLIRFSFSDEFRAAPSAEAWQHSNVPILSAAALRASLEIFGEAGMEELRARSLRLTELLDKDLRRRCGDAIEILTPREPERRGSQISIGFRERGPERFAAMHDAGVVCDFRRPGIVRLAPTALYSSEDELIRTADIIASIL